MSDLKVWTRGEIVGTLAFLETRNSDAWGAKVYQLIEMIKGIETLLTRAETAEQKAEQQQAEIGRLREALAWYADEANYEIGIYDSEINANEAPPIWDDGGLKAREVLKGGAG